MANGIDALVIGDNRFSYHQFERMGPLLKETLEDGRISAELTTDRDALLLDNLREYDVVVDYMTDSTLNGDQRDGLLSFVENGHGYVGIHTASDLTRTEDGFRDEPFPELRDLIGGHFIDHPSPSTFDVAIVDSHHPITADLDRFTVWDEPYRLEVDTDDLRILARMDHPELGDMPVAWVKPYHDGRVFYSSLGDDRPAHTNEAARRLAVNGTRWAASDY
jgi:type 1 glutamine amidotransferase